VTAPAGGESALAAIAAEELRKQRTFLSTDEAAALSLPAELEDEENLALVRVRGRRLWIYTALRDRFIGDGRPFDDWLAMIDAEEGTAGGETQITRLARQVLEWSVRSGDREAMLGGFVAKALRYAGLLLLLLAGWSWWQGAGGAAVVTTGALAVVLLVGSSVVGRRAAARAAFLVAGLRERQSKPEADPAPDAAYETESA
jgi:hypothetical protein